MKLENSRQILKKYLNTNFHENLTIGTGRLETDIQTDRPDGSNINFSQFYERV